MSTPEFPSGPEKIILNFDELNTSEVTERVYQMQEAQRVVTVRQVGQASQNSSGTTIRAILIMAAGGFAGGLISFLLNKAFSAIVYPNGTTADGAPPVWVANVSFTFLMAFSIGASLALIDAATTKSASKVGQAAAISIPSSLGIGLVVGGMAHFLYNSMTTAIYKQVFVLIQDGTLSTEAEAANWVRSHQHLPRGLAWLLVGVAAGLTVGIASRSGKRLLFTTLGGAVGGFVGGYLFDFFTGEALAQIVGFCITGILVGLSMALVEQARKSQWIEIVSGGMAGKQFIIYKDNITIGSSPSSDIQLIKDPAVPPTAARLITHGASSILESADFAHPVNVEGQLGQRFPLFDGATLTFGSTIIRYRSKAGQQAMPTGGPVRLQ